MQYLKHCRNPKVIAGLVVVAASTWVFAPGAFAAATQPAEPAGAAADPQPGPTARR